MLKRFHFPFQYRCAASSRTGGARASAACVFLRVALRTCQGAKRGHGSFYVYFLDAALAAKRLRCPNECLDIPWAKRRLSAHAALPPQFCIHSVQQTLLPRIYMDARRHSNYLCFVCVKPRGVALTFVYAGSSERSRIVCARPARCRDLFPQVGVWRNGSASDSRSEGWEFESLCPHIAKAGDAASLF